MSRLSRFSRQSRPSRRLGTLTAYRRCVIPTGLAHRLGALSKQPGNARIPYDDLPVLDYALLGVFRIVEWAGRLAAALRRTAILDYAFRLGKIETPPRSAPRTRTQDSRPERLSQPLYNLVRLIAVFCLSPVA